MLVDHVLCLLMTDYVELLSLVGHNLCFLRSKLFNFEHNQGSFIDIKRTTKILLKSVHLNIRCNLFIDPWGGPIVVNPLNLHESQEPLPY